jgi:hypothetical protein
LVLDLEERNAETLGELVAFAAGLEVLAVKVA